MREIKFRAWLSGKHGNITFPEPSMEYGCSVGENGEYLSIEGGWDIQGGYPSVPVMQFTGLTDKNGVKIYEGDIIIHDSTEIGGERFDCCEVLYTTDLTLAASPCFSLWSHGKKSGWLDLGLGDVEVIGNIHANPELLENNRGAN